MRPYIKCSVVGGFLTAALYSMAPSWGGFSTPETVATPQASAQASGPSSEERLTGLEAFYTARIAQDPIAMSAMNVLASVYVSRARLSGDVSYYAKAESLLERSLRVTASVHNLDARAQLACVRLAQHRFGEARKMAEALLALHPRHRHAMAVAGDALLEQGDL